MKLDELIAQYPILQSVECGVQCGNGWVNLLDILCGTIEAHLLDRRELKDFRVDQVKEKFGGLRFYVSGGDEFIDGMISLTENLSYTICEECGNPGEVTGKSWYKVLCRECV